MPLTIDSIAAALKSETLLPHQQAETALQRRMEAISGYADYARILKIFYGYFTPVLQNIRQHITTNQLPDIGERRTSELILADLAALGEKTSELPISSSLPRIENEEQAFGALYVLEGSTLGGRVIRKMMLDHPIGLKEEQLQFFNGYGSETGNRWKAFVEALNEQKNYGEIRESAIATFAHFQKWIEQEHE